MWRISWRGVREHPVRFLLSILAVVLGIAFVTGTFALRTSLSDTFSAISGSSYEDDIYLTTAASSDSNVQGMGTASAGVPLTVADSLDGVDGVASHQLGLSGNGVLVGADGTAVTTNGAPTLMMVLAPNLSSVTVLSGNMPTKPGEIALEESAMEPSGLGVGDETKIIVGGEVTPVTVVGEWRYSTATFGAVLVAIDQETGEAAFAPRGLVPNIGVTLSAGADLDTVMKNVANAVGSDVTAIDSDEGGYSVTLSDGTGIAVRSGADLRAELAKSIDDILGFVSVFLLVFAAVALFIGGFLISNTFTMSVRQRMREFAVLRAIGASPLQVFVSVVTQAAIVGLAGGVLGVLGGWGLISLVQAVFASMGASLASGAPITIETVVISMSVALVVSIVAAAIPARRAAVVPPVAAMREKDTPERSLTVRGIIGGVVVIAGVGAVIAAGIAGDGFGALLGVGAAALLLGALLVAPVLVPAILGALRPLLKRFAQPIGPIAVSNVTRNPRRTASTSSALMIGMALIGAATVLASSTQASLADSVMKSAVSDYVLTGQLGSIPDAVPESIAQVDGAGEVDSVRSAYAQVGNDRVSISTATDGTWQRSLTLPMVSGDLDTAIANGDAVLSESAAKNLDLAVGDTITLQEMVAAPQAGADAPAVAQPVDVSLVVGGILSDSSILSTDVVVPTDAFADLTARSASSVLVVLVTAADGTSLDELHTRLVDAVKPFYVVSVLTAEQWTGQLADQVTQVLNILYALLGISIVIAILGIVNTLALSIIERTREIGLMRAVGMGRLQLAGTITVESVLISVFGAALGLVIGVGVASALPSILASSGLGTLFIPWGTLLQMLLIAAVVGVLAALWPAARATRLPVLDAISSGE